MSKKIFFIILFFNLVGASFAEKKLESKYFFIYLQDDIDIINLAKKLDIRSEYLLNSSFLDEPKIILAKIIDAIFLEVSDILDIHLESFKGNIKIYKDFDELNKIFKSFFDKNLNTFSFYISSSNTIFIDFENIKAEVLAHEIAHAIINRYFVVLPPVNVQEILSKYVEYKIKKLATKNQ
ncbi:MAG: hypothetical protein NC918_02180 [Candidatus Omnitrophica bacterium]|nr:hypothetical protein [Candidatus Omnitrophota bacterium]